LTAGILKGTPIGNVTQGGTSFGQMALQGAVNSTVSQGVNIALGLQDSFSWKEIAISAVSTAVAGEVSQRVGFDSIAVPDAVATFGSQLVAGASSALVRRAIGGKLDTNAVMADVFGTALGNSLVVGMAPQSAAQSQARNGSSDEMEEILVTAPAITDGVTGQPLDSNPRNVIRSGAEISPDEVAAVTSSGSSGWIETVVSTAPKWRVGENEHYWQQQFTYSSAFGQFLDEDYATGRAVELHQDDIQQQVASIRDRDLAILMDAFSPYGHVKNAVAGGWNLGVKTIGGALSAPVALWGVEPALAVQDWASGARIDVDSPAGDAMARGLRPYINEAEGWLEDHIGVGGTIALGATAEFALDASVLLTAGTSVRRLAPDLDIPLRSPLYVDLQGTAAYSGLPLGVRSPFKSDIAAAEVPIAYGTPYRQLSSNARAELLAKAEDRTITREEWGRLQWNDRLTDRRQQGIDDFWEIERQQLASGLPGTRKWSSEATAKILAGGKPRGIFSHHAYSVSRYPQLANQASNIVPVTFNEHLYRWHGGNWGNPTHGEPLSPDIPEQF
jgi:hypothetical protein